jgi:hypothetical protein
MATLRDTLLGTSFALAAFAMGCGNQAERPPALADYTAPRRDAGADIAVDSDLPATCNFAATRIYLMDTEGALYRFDPMLLPARGAFQKIGVMDCSWSGAASMAVDRNAVAWVTDESGLLFEVSTSDAKCRRTNFHNQHGFTKVGMGFAGDAALGTETLYLSDTSNAAITGGGNGFASLDLVSLELTPIANFDGSFAGQGAELTGSGDGRLFGFFPTAVSLTQIDPATAHILASYDVARGTPTSGSGEFDFALSFWGGIFFLYTAYKGNVAAPTTDITAFDPATGESMLVASQIGFNVTGAGSSTCVPTKGKLDMVSHGIVGTFDSGQTD